MVTYFFYDHFENEKENWEKVVNLIHVIGYWYPIQPPGPIRIQVEIAKFIQNKYELTD